jgi:hypothetical protein
VGLALIVILVLATVMPPGIGINQPGRAPGTHPGGRELEMKRTVWALCAVFALGAVAYATPPGGSHAYGKSLTDWMKGYMTYLLGVDQPTRDKNVVYMPLPAAIDTGGGHFEGEMNVSLKTGDAFAMTIYVWYGELYGDDSTDPWDYVEPAGITDDTNVLLKIDGKTFIDSSKDDMSDWYFEFDPTQWDNPVYYAAPTELGAIAAVWAKGLGFVHAPLSKGTHTMEIWVTNGTYGGDWHNVWHISVTK